MMLSYVLFILKFFRLLFKIVNPFRKIPKTNKKYLLLSDRKSTGIFAADNQIFKRRGLFTSSVSFSP